MCLLILRGTVLDIGYNCIKNPFEALVAIFRLDSTQFQWFFQEEGTIYHGAIGSPPIYLSQSEEVKYAEY